VGVVVGVGIGLLGGVDGKPFDGCG
jgi:hypothetical protein